MSDIKEEEPLNENLSKMYRAAEISKQVNSVTIGPNSSFNDKDSLNSKEDDKENIKKPARKSENSMDQQVVEKLNKMNISDLKNFQHQIAEQSRNKMIELEVRKKLEEKRAEEVKKYAEIKNNIEKMRQEAEMKHKLKMQEFERQIKAELEKERLKELEYQDQRKTLAANRKKIQEEKERILREQIKKFDDVFVKQESAFLKIIQSTSPEMATALDSFKKQLKDIKNLKDSQKDSLEGTKSCCIKLDALCQSLQKEIKELDAAIKTRKAQKEAEDVLNAQLAEEARKKEVIVPKQIVAVPPRSQDQSGTFQESNSLQSQALKIFNEYRLLLATKKEQTKTLEEVPELQQLRFALKYAINNPINLLNENNKTTLVDGYQKLFNLLSGQRVNTLKGNVSITDHNEAPTWCRLRIAEKIIDRCDKNPGIEFFAASLTIALWQKFPDFGEIFKAILFRECPFLMPVKPPKQSNQSNEEFLSSWGYRLTNGVCEDQFNYEGRTSKFASLIAALWISFPRKGEPEISPYDIRHAWIYFANVLNTHPDSEYLHIIAKILEVCGFMMHQIYGKQFVKIMLLIRDNYIPAVQSSIDEESSASFNRLREVVHGFFTEKKFNEPKGRVIYGYW